MSSNFCHPNNDAGTYQILVIDDQQYLYNKKGNFLLIINIVTIVNSYNYNF